MGTRYIAGVLMPVALFIPMLACTSVDVSTLIAHNEQGHYGRTVKAGRTVLVQSPDDAEAHLQLGLAYSHLDSVAEAYHHFKRAIALDPDDAALVAVAERTIRRNADRYLDAGRDELARGAVASAARNFLRATQADPRRGDAWYELGVAYARLAMAADGFRDDAARAFRAAVDCSSAADPWYSDAAERARELAPPDLRSSLRR